MKERDTQIGQLAKSTLEQTEDGLPLREYWQVVRKRAWTIAFVTAVVIGLGALYLANQENVYEASVTLEIRTETPQVLGGEVEPVVDPAAGARYWSTQEYYETQYRIIRSRSVAEEVVTALQLAENLEFLGIDSDADGEARRAALESADPIQHLRAMTRVTPIPDSQLVKVSVEHTDPQLAMLLANTIAEVYVARNARQQLRGTDAAFHWLEAERTDLRERAEEAEHTLLQYRQENDIRSSSLVQRHEQLTEYLNAVQELLVAAQADVSEIRAERRRVRQARDEGNLDSVPIPAVIDNPLIQALKQRREELRDEAARLDARYGERHPEVRGVADALEQVESNLDREIGSILDSYDVRLERAEGRERDLRSQREQIESEMRSLSQAEPAYNLLQLDIDNNAEILAMIERRYKETDLYRRQQDVNNIEVLDAAILPDAPVRPRKRMIMALAMLLGGMLGIGFAFLLEVLDTTVRTQEDVERALGFTFLGVVPSIRPAARERARMRQGLSEDWNGRDLFIHHNPKSSVAECCRSIRTNLHFMSPDKELRQLLVTSAGPREGKTSTAINLATVMAQSQHRVLLVDTDMRRPRLHKAFDLKNQLGLTNLILGEVAYEEAIRETLVPNLHVLPCGPIPPNPTELMHTDRFRTIVSELGSRYDRVIFDSPPVIAVADAMILGGEVDGVLFVIKSGQTSKEVVKRAKGQLDGINLPILGAILNDLDLEDRAYRYHYYYSYYSRHGQYYEEGESDERDAVDDRQTAPV